MPERAYRTFFSPGEVCGIRAWSGNGIHINYRLPDLPPIDEHKLLVKSALTAIAAKFGSDLVEVDLTVFNPARIWKVYGTTARKGDSTIDRPHRKGGMFPGPPERLECSVSDPVGQNCKLARIAHKVS